MARQIIIGIYKITNPNGKIYIGQSIDIFKRFTRYKSDVKSQLALNNSFIKYGVKNHNFEIIEECIESCLNERERYWQDYYDVTGANGLNCRLTGTKDKSGALSDETKLKMKIAKKGFNLGKVTSDETKSKMSLAHLGFKHSKTTKNKMSQIKNINKVNHNANKIVLDLNTGVFYYSVFEAAKYFDVNENTLYNWLTGRRKNKKENLILI